MNTYIIKTEPHEYSIDDLVRDHTTIWNGVTNPQAVKHIKAWNIGDRLYIYHSGEKKIVGLAMVVELPYQSPDNPRSFEAKIRFVKKYPEDLQVSLADFKANPDFADFALVRQGRLSVVLCTLEVITWLEGKGLK